MTLSVLLALHIAVLGYWLGSELVINSEYRFVVRRADLPVVARDALMDHLMQADQHVRYALVLQATLGTMLLASMGFLSGSINWLGALGGFIWLVLVEATHRLRKLPVGLKLAQFDRVLRYFMATVIVVAGLVMSDWPGWLRIKLVLFAGIIGCGILIRFQLIRHFSLWAEIVSSGSTPDREAALGLIYRKATGVLIVLWALIAAISLLALFKPV